MHFTHVPGCKPYCNNKEKGKKYKSMFHKKFEKITKNVNGGLKWSPIEGKKKRFMFQCAHIFTTESVNKTIFRLICRVELNFCKNSIHYNKNIL